jgi:PIN domain nuclease of toxin-antitoxin system
MKKQSPSQQQRVEEITREELEHQDPMHRLAIEGAIKRGAWKLVEKRSSAT